MYDNLDNIDGKEELKENEEKDAYLVKVDGYLFLVSKTTGEITKKDLEIADGGVDNSREIDEEEFNTLKETLKMQQNEISELTNIVQNQSYQFEELKTNAPNSLSSWVKIADYPSGYNIENFIIIAGRIDTLVNGILTYRDPIPHHNSSHFIALSQQIDGIYMWITNQSHKNQSVTLLFKKI